MPNLEVPFPTAMVLLLAVVSFSTYLVHRRVPFLLWGLGWASLALVPAVAQVTREGWAAVSVTGAAALATALGSVVWNRGTRHSALSALPTAAVVGLALAAGLYALDPDGGFSSVLPAGLLAGGWLVAGGLLFRRARAEAPVGAVVAGLGFLAWGVLLPLEWITKHWFVDPYWLSQQDAAGAVLGVGLVIMAAELTRQDDDLPTELEALLEEDPNMICVVRDGEVVFANRALRERSGNTLSELRQAGRLAHLAEPGRMEALQRAVKIRRGGIPSYETDFLDGGGREVPVIVNTHPIEWRGAPAWRYELVDISDRRQAEREVREMMKELQRVNAELEDANRMQAEFLSNTSHELKTPLTSIIANAEVLEYEMVGPVNEQQRRVLGTIARNSQHLLEMISQLLAFARQREGHETLRLQPVPVRPLLENVVETVHPLLEEAGLEVALEVDAGLTCSLDPEKIYRVYLNLVENAIKFSREGVVRVVAHRVGRELEGSVSDQGIGIPVDKLDEIFQPFRQVDASPTRSYGGVGLGLAICRHLVELHGGRIWAEPAAGHGTTIRFRLPCDAGGGEGGEAVAT